MSKWNFRDRIQHPREASHRNNPSRRQVYQGINEKLQLRLAKFRTLIRSVIAMRDLPPSLIYLQFHGLASYISRVIGTLLNESRMFPL